VRTDADHQQPDGVHLVLQGRSNTAWHVTLLLLF
jgi:hypothetical protein